MSYKSRDPALKPAGNKIFRHMGSISVTVQNNGQMIQRTKWLYRGYDFGPRTPHSQKRNSR